MPDNPLEPSQISYDEPPLLPYEPDTRPKRRRIWLIVGAVVVVVILIALGWYFFAPGKQAAGDGAGAQKGGRRGGDAKGAAPLPVATAPATTADFTVYLNALGNVTARNTVTVRPRVDGQLLQVQFQEGQLVKSGELLAQIDPKPFEVALQQANGQLARDQAQLTNARIDLERYQTLLKQDSIAQQQVDTQAALVRQFEGTIEADRGAVENAKLNLSWTRITAPLGGRTGLRLVDPGNMVHTTDANGIVVITQVQPINVLYAIPEDKLAQVLKRTRAGDTLLADAYDRDGKVKLASGKLLTVDNQIDPATGTVKLKAEFPNDNFALFPNQFVNMRMQLDTLKGATVVPTAAIQRGSPGTFVYRVNAGNTVSVAVVKLGPSEGESTVIESGVSPGDTLVVDGADKLKDGAKIEPVARNANGAPAKGDGTRPGATKGGREGRGKSAPTEGLPATPGASPPAPNAPPAPPPNTPAASPGGLPSKTPPAQPSDK
jgi:multidrug efflux system membrane fusion protein